MRGIRESNKRRKIYNFLHDQNYDIVLMQETHSTPTSEKFWSTTWGGKIYFDHGTSDSKGCAIMFKKGLQPKIHDIVRDVDGRYIIMKIEFEQSGHNNSKIALGCIYAPNDDTPEFFHRFFEQVEQIAADHIILGGDFNTILTERDIKGGRGHSHKKSTAYLNHYFEDTGLVDIWRVRHPDEFRFTWSRKNPHPIMETLDYIIVSFQLQQHIRITDISPS